MGKVYSHPPYRGHWLHGKTFRVGEWIGEIFEFATSADGMYVTGRTSGGWVNIWCAKNNQGKYRGVYFVELTSTRRLEARQVPVVPDDFFGDRRSPCKGDY